ncbi:MAG: acyltransferase [Candidatus Obscuribacterales bacterium]|nr:acyltransferase [Candidatus Obscuribacterales bacterium]
MLIKETVSTPADGYRTSSSVSQTIRKSELNICLTALAPFKTKERLDVLTGYRGIAAYSVLFAHTFGLLTLGKYEFPSHLACFGMSLFFVLSGFVITYNYEQLFGRENFASAIYKFFVARFARLYPLYVVIISANILWAPSLSCLHKLYIVLSYLTLTQSWFNLQKALFTPAWSISTEWFFYLAFIPMTVLLRRITKPAWTLTVFCIVTTIALILVFNLFKAPLILTVGHLLPATGKIGISASAWDWITYFSPVTRLFDFIAGAMTAKAYQSLKGTSPSALLAQCTLVAALLWCTVWISVSWNVFPWLSDLLHDFIFAPGIAALLLITCLYKSRLTNLLSSAPCLLAGDISYSVYIWSIPVMKAVSVWLDRDFALQSAAIPIKALICIAATTLLAYGSYSLIEQPSRRWIRGRLS